MAWRVENGNLIVRLPTGWRSRPEYRLAVLCVDDEVNVELRATNSGDDLLVPVDLWKSLGEVESKSDPELRDQWALRVEGWSSLLGLAPMRLDLASSGGIGGSFTEFILKLDGRRVSLSGDWPSRDGAYIPVSPVVFRAWCTLRDLPPRASLNVQHHALAQFRAQLDAAAEALEGTPAAVSLRLDPHLAKRKYRRSVRTTFTTEAIEGHRDAYRIAARVTDDHGDEHLVDAPRAEAEAGWLKTPGGDYVLLPENTRSALRAVDGHGGSTAQSLGQLVEHPERALPDGVADESMEFHGFSERVLGFSPVGADGAAPHESTGIAWFDDSDAGAPAATAQIVAETPGGQPVNVRPSSAEEAQAALVTIDALLASGNETGVVRVGGQLVRATLDLRRRLAATAQSTPRGSDDGRQTAVPKTLAADLADVETSAATSVPLTPVPWERLNHRLLPRFQLKVHQRDGVAWLYRHWASRPPRYAGVLLADDMGLGKTLQLASLMVLTREQEPTTPRRTHLVVCPKILIECWDREIQNYFRTKTLRVRKVNARDLVPGKGALVDDAGTIEPRELAASDLWVLSYNTLEAYGRTLAKAHFGIVVLDEGQHIKNPATARSRNARALHFDFGVVSTGTPVENGIQDLFALFDFAKPSLLAANATDFRTRYTSDDKAAVAEIRSRLRYPGAESLVLHRKKSDVLAHELPTKHPPRVAKLPMTERQRQLEAEVVRKAFANRGRLGATFEALGNLQKLYQHPALLDTFDGASSIEALIEASPKLKYTVEVARDVAARGEKLLIFTLWTRMQLVLQRVLEERLATLRLRRDPIAILNGEPHNQARALREIDAFAAHEGFDVMILSPLAAGTGLNICAANHVLHYGRWWNPAKEDQATDRAYRIGQQREVHVYVPLLHHANDPEEGFDVKLHELVERKRGYARDFLDVDRGPTAADFQTLFQGTT